MGITPSERNLALLAAASRLDGSLGAVANLAATGASRTLGLLVNGMTVYGSATSSRAFYEQLDEENARMVARGRAKDPEKWPSEVSEQIEGSWVRAFEDDERDDHDLVTRNHGIDPGEMSEDDERGAIRHSATTLTLADATVFPSGGPHFNVPLLRIRLSEIAGWWLIPTDADGNASIKHPSTS